MNDPATEQPDAWLNVSPWLRENVCKLPTSAKKWSEQVNRCKFMHTHAVARSKTRWWSSPKKGPSAQENYDKISSVCAEKKTEKRESWLKLHCCNLNAFSYI